MRDLAQYLMAASAAIPLLLGLLHLLYTFHGPLLRPRDAELQERMAAVSPVITRQTTMWKAWIGFNASHSFGLILFGLAYGYLALRHPAFLLESAFLLALGLVLLGAYAFLAVRYFFRVPLRGILLALALYLLALISAAAQAQTYPAKTLRFIVPFPPGGGVDIVARALSEKLSPRLGQPIVIENKPGAGTQIGTDAAAKSAPDGYTLLVGPVGSQAIVHLMHGKRNYDFRRDLAPVARIGHGTIALIVPKASPAQSVKELVALAKANPGRLTFASSGTGALIHLTGELFKQQAGIDMTHIPYKGTSQILPDLLDGRIDMALDSLPAYLTHLKAGRVRALAVASPQRSALMPDVPTMAEAGLPGVLSQTDYAVYVPMGTPKEALALLNREINVVLRDDDFRAKLASQGIRIDPGTPAELDAEFVEELDKWRRVMREANIKPES